ncbi:MAG: hypothetical protein ACE361_17415 [Aureliella sp.]
MSHSLAQTAHHEAGHYICMVAEGVQPQEVVISEPTESDASKKWSGRVATSGNIETGALARIAMAGPIAEVRYMFEVEYRERSGEPLPPEYPEEKLWSDANRREAFFDAIVDEHQKSAHIIRYQELGKYPGIQIHSAEWGGDRRSIRDSSPAIESQRRVFEMAYEVIAQRWQEVVEVARKIERRENEIDGTPIRFMSNESKTQA